MLVRVCLLSVLWLCCTAQAAGSLKLNQLQWIGSHNSYKQALPDGASSYMQQQGQDTSSLQYQHLPLQQQLTNSADFQQMLQRRRERADEFYQYKGNGKLDICYLGAPVRLKSEQ